MKLSFRAQAVVLASAFLVALVWSVLTVPLPSYGVERHSVSALARDTHYSHTVLVKGHKEVTMFATAHCSGEPDVVLPGDRVSGIRSFFIYGRGVWRAHGKRHVVKHGACVHAWRVKPGLVKVRDK